MRFSRPCYDKPHRCPGRAGGGNKYAEVERCNGGSISTRKPIAEFPGEYEHPAAAPWRFGHCDTCDVVTWPWALRWLSPWTIKYEIARRWRDLRYRYGG